MIYIQYSYIYLYIYQFIDKLLIYLSIYICNLIGMNDLYTIFIHLFGDCLEWGFSKMENPSKMDDLGVPLFQETSIYVSINLLIIYLFIYLSIFVIIGINGENKSQSHGLMTSVIWGYPQLTNHHVSTISPAV